MVNKDNSLQMSSLLPIYLFNPNFCRGFDKGSADFGVTVRTLLCCIRGLPQFDKEKHFLI